MKKRHIAPVIAAVLFSSSAAMADTIYGPAYGIQGIGIIDSTSTQMTADYSVRYNDAAPGQWVQVEFNSSREIWFSNSEWFMCRVSPGSALYDKAFGILLGFKNGYTIKANGGGWQSADCTSVSMTFSSTKVGAEHMYIEVPAQ